MTGLAIPGIRQRLFTALTFPNTRSALGELRAHRRMVVPRPVRVAMWWAGSLLVMAVYAVLRGKMDDVGMPVHGDIWERALFGSLPTLWLQHHIWTLAPKPLEWTAVAIHASWFFVPPIAGLFVTWRRPDRIGSFFRWWIALDIVALVLFALLPLRPPWMADPQVTRIIAIRYGGHIGDSNPLAAMPSLHVAFPLMISLWFFRERWKGPALAMLGYSLLVSLEVVFSGEHYVVDVMGATFTAGAIALAARVNYAAVFDRLSSLSLRRRPASGVPRLKPALERVRGERGQAIIEMILVLPLIFVFILVLVDFGIALDHREVIQHAVREGARHAAVGNSVADVQSFTVDESKGILSTANVYVCYVDLDGNGNPGNPGDAVRVGVGDNVNGAVTYTYKFSVGGGEMLTVFGVPVPSIDMDPYAQETLEAPVPGAKACPP